MTKRTDTDGHPMNYLLRATTVATIVIVLGTAAFAVAETQRYPGAEGIPVVVTHVTPSVAASGTPGAIVPTATAPAPAKPSSPAASNPSNPSSNRKSKPTSGSSSRNGSTQKSNRTPDASPDKSGTTQEPKREVIKPDVRDDSEGAGDSGDTKSDSPDGTSDSHDSPEPSHSSDDSLSHESSAES